MGPIENTFWDYSFFKDLLKICLEEKEYTAASYINEEILNKGNLF